MRDRIDHTGYQTLFPVITFFTFHQAAVAQGNAKPKKPSKFLRLTAYWKHTALEGKRLQFLQEKLVWQVENQVCLIGGNKAVCPCPLRNSTQPCGIGGFESSPDQNSSAIYRPGRGMLEKWLHALLNSPLSCQAWTGNFTFTLYLAHFGEVFNGFFLGLFLLGPHS